MTRASDTARLVSGGAVFNEASNDVDFRVESNGDANMLFVDAGNDRVYLGRNATDGVGNARLQIEAQDGEAGVSIHRGSASTGGGKIFFSKSRAATAGDDTVVQSGDQLGALLFTGADGTDRASAGAEISVEVDGTPGSNDMPGRIIFSTTADDASSTTERMRINSAGAVSIGTTSSPNNAPLLVHCGTDDNLRFNQETHATISAVNDAANAFATLKLEGDDILLNSQSGNNVGIGTTSPTFATGGGLQVKGSSFTSVRVTSGGNTGIDFSQTTDGTSYLYSRDNADLIFGTNNTERMRIDSSGLLRIANTSGTLYSSSSATGIVAGTSLQVSTDGGTAGFFNRLSSDGQILGFYKDGTQVGQISSGDLSSASRILIGNSNCNLLFNDAIPEIVPASSNGVKRDDAIDLGNATGRFDDIRATNGTIQTSDKNEKNTIVDSDLGIDFVNLLTPKSYKFNNKTRTHYGLIAQDVETVLGDVKKDASQFAGFCKDDISEKQDGSEYRYGLRYHEFISPMIQAIKDLKAEVDTLKTKVATLESK